MKTIELRSEKVRNIIGSIPPILVRTGNILVIIFISVLLGVSSIIKVPNTVNCEIIIEKKSDNGAILKIISLKKIITKPIKKGAKVRVYIDNDFLFTGKLSSNLSHIELKDNKINIAPLSLDKIILNEKMMLTISEKSKLNGVIFLDENSILESVFKYKN